MLSEALYEQYAFLDRSFEFLVPKKDCVPKWIKECPRCFLSFFAGYFDAEGCILLHKDDSFPFAGFELQTYDKNIITNSWRSLKKLGIFGPKPLISTKKGYIDKRGIKHNGDNWRLSIFAKESVWILAQYFSEILRHRDKVAKLDMVKENIIFRNCIPYNKRVVSLVSHQLPLHNHKKGPV